MNDNTISLYTQIVENGTTQPDVMSCVAICMNAINDKGLAYSLEIQRDMVLNAILDYSKSNDLYNSISLFMNNLTEMLTSLNNDGKGGNTPCLIEDNNDYKELFAIFSQAFKLIVVNNIVPNKNIAPTKKRAKPMRINSSGLTGLGESIKTDLELVKGTSDLYIGKKGSSHNGKAYLNRGTNFIPLFDILPTKVTLTRKGRNKVYTIIIQDQTEKITATELRCGKGLDKFKVNLGTNNNISCSQYAQIVAFLAEEEIEDTTDNISIISTTENDNPNMVMYEDVLDVSEYSYPKKFTGVQYLFVRSGELIGIWLATFDSRSGKMKIKQLTNYDIQVLNIVSPSMDNKRADYVLSLQITDVSGEVHLLKQNKEQRLKHSLEVYVKSFGLYPTSLSDKQHLDAAIQHLGLQSHITNQRSVQTLGWHAYNGNRVFVLENGCETLEGFKEDLEAPFSLLDDDNVFNGYKGCTVNKPNDDILHLKFEQLNPNKEIEIIDAALLGLTVAVEYPTCENAGTVKTVTEIVGPTRHGKSVKVNNTLTAFGTGFKYDKGTLLNNTGPNNKGDTGVGANAALAYANNIIISDFDYSLKVDDSRYDDLYKTRVNKNATYANDATGGLKGNRDSSMAVRPKAIGALLRTGETDFAKYKPNDLSTEMRVCTFIWPCVCDKLHNPNCPYIGIEDISIKIDKKRIEYYAWHVYFRKWIMSKSDDTLKANWNKCEEEVNKNELFANHNWLSLDLHKNHCKLLVTSLLIWKMFLQEWFQESFMINWIDAHIPLLIQDRINRCRCIAYDVKQEQVSNIADQAIDILKKLLHHGTGHIKTDKGHFLTKEYITTNNVDIHAYQLGYKEEMKNAKKMINGSGDAYGFLIKKGTYIGLHSEIVIAAILGYATRNNIKLGTSDDILSALEQAGYIQVYVEKTTNKKLYVTRSRIAGKQRWLLTIPINVIFPVVEEGEVFNEEDVEPTPNNITNIEDHRKEDLNETEETSTGGKKPNQRTKKVKTVVQPSINTSQAIDGMLSGDIV